MMKNENTKNYQEMIKDIEFIVEIDKAKNILRQTYLTDAKRKENDAEHSWHLAVMATVLSNYANEKIDIVKVMIMVLLHDIIEIDAGDTYAYDEKAHEQKKIKEEKAADRIYGLLSKEKAKRYRQIWDEFEERKTPEAIFANTLDKIQPILLNNASMGRSWVEHQVKKSQIINRNENTKDGSFMLWDYCEKLIEENVKKGKIIDE